MKSYVPWLLVVQNTTGVGRILDASSADAAGAASMGPRVVSGYPETGEASIEPRSYDRGKEVMDSWVDTMRRAELQGASDVTVRVGAR